MTTHYKKLNVPDNFTHLELISSSCLYPRDNVPWAIIEGSDDFFYMVTKCGRNSEDGWPCSKCLASRENMPIAKEYLRRKRLEKINESTT